MEQYNLKLLKKIIMETKNGKSACETALKNLQAKMKKAILNEELEMKITPYFSSITSTSCYYADIEVKLGGCLFTMAIADTFICYHTKVLDGMFDKKADFNKLTKIVRKYLKIPTAEDIQKIKDLEEQIAILKGGEVKLNGGA